MCHKKGSRRCRQGAVESTYRSAATGYAVLHAVVVVRTSLYWLATQLKGPPPGP
jgi:hypothetical protein